MPRQFNYRRGFPSLDINTKKTPQEMLTELDDDDIQALVDEAFPSIIINVNEIRRREGSEYIEFLTDYVDRSETGIFEYFIHEEKEPFIRGIIKVEGSVRPIYTAKITLRLGKYNSYGDYSSRLYTKAYGTLNWEDKGFTSNY